MVVKNSVLKELEDAYKMAGNQLYLLYGRVDCEKELMLKAFLQNKKYFYYRSRYASPEEQRTRMGQEIFEKFQVSLTKYAYEEYFNRVKSGGPEKLVIVIDEFQYISKKDSEFMEAIRKLKAKRLYPGPVLIVLCSSAVAWVEQEMPEVIGAAAEKGIDRKIKIGNLNFLEVVRALPDYSVSECIKVYGILGGVAGYLNRWNIKQDLKSNICRLILSRNGYLYRAAEELLSESLRELSVYETILATIADGNDKLNDLSKKTGFSRAKVSVYMKNLSAFDIIQKVVSFETGGWDHAKKGIYRIQDNYVNFWFHFVYPHLSDLYMMSPEEFYDTHILPGLDSYLGRYFSEVCMEYMGLLGSVGKLPLQVTKMGTWIGKEGSIDIIAQNSMRQYIVGLCNWNQPKLDMGMCEKLFESMKLAKIKAEYYFLFSAREFAEDVRAMAEQDKRFILVDMNEL
ncbi:MAG: DUF234 domain-containing protein [Clostridiales bacterium]|nr:DUF234 domain-containing protein [Clostridiales bacterium]